MSIPPTPLRVAAPVGAPVAVPPQGSIPFPVCIPPSYVIPASAPEPGTSKVVPLPSTPARAPTLHDILQAIKSLETRLVRVEASIDKTNVMVAALQASRPTSIVSQRPGPLTRMTKDGQVVFE